MEKTHLNYDGGLERIQVLIQGLAKRWSPGLVNFVPAVAYHFYLALPVAFTQPGDHQTSPVHAEQLFLTLQDRTLH